ncbi:N-methyl-L-tryptophan oxidase [Brevibacterium renqingii]|uniref:N-methyl-L-tryptophan oxidase n=1 Tax=Brevibacterium renqingii TaxID=2776916 RepID=UPI001AE03129
MGKLTHKADVIVVGVGAFGSAVAWRLAARGMDVIALDQESIPNDKGSSHGQTRIFRALSQNHVDLFPLAMLSKQLWRELQDATKQRLFEASGALIIGENGRGRIANALEVARRFGIEPQVLSSGELRRQYPAFSNVSDDEVALVDPEGGLLFTEECVEAAVSQARSYGAQIRENIEVHGHREDGDDVVVRTSEGDFRAQQVVYATGAWTAKLFPQLNLDPLRIPQCWFSTEGSEHESPTLSDIPPFQRDLNSTDSLWGHGAAAPGWFTKIGTHGHPTRNRSVDTDNIDRTVHDDDVEYLSSLVGTSFDNLSSTPVESSICLLTMTCDEQFVVGRMRDSKVFVASGGSGQGFKHATGVGEVIADLCQGVEPSIDYTFMSPDRILSQR